VDVGPILSDVAGRHIDDEDGDGYFEGRASDAWVAVDSPCPDVPPTVFPTPPRATAAPLPTGDRVGTGPPHRNPAAVVVQTTRPGDHQRRSRWCGSGGWALSGGDSAGALIECERLTSIDSQTRA
jgi:hypothetical protein